VKSVKSADDLFIGFVGFIHNRMQGQGRARGPKASKSRMKLSHSLISSLESKPWIGGSFGEK
jgi:hypothetical protein